MAATASPPRLQFIDDAHLSFYTWLLQVVFLLFAISILIWICLTPKSPVFIVTNASLSNQPFSDGNVTSVVLDLEISNPNQGYGFYFSNILVSLNGSVFVANGSVSEIYLGYGDRMIREVSLNGTTTKIGSCLDDGVVRLRLRTGVEFKDKVIGSRTKRKEIEYGADFRVGSDGKIIILGGKQVLMLLSNNHQKVTTTSSRRDGHPCINSSRKFLRHLHTLGIVKKS